MLRRTPNAQAMPENSRHTPRVRTTRAYLAGFGTAGTLVVLEVIAAARSRSTKGELAVQLAVSTLLGLGVLALKVVLH